MRLSFPLINNVGRLRSGWRVFVFALFFMAFLIASDLIVLRFEWRTITRGDQILDVVRRTLMMAGALGAGYLCARLLEGLPWRSLGLTFRTAWLRELLLGSLIGIFSLALAVAIATAAGGFSFTVSKIDMIRGVTRSVCGSALLFIIAALAEEAVFRGYPLQTLSRARLAWLGVLLTSVPFAMAHLWNPNSGKLPFANTALAGIWLAIAYFRTRSLWFPLGVHWAWNWALGSLFGLPVSGLTLVSNPLMKATDLGPAWLTGGNYGIEGGAACTVALLVSSLFLWRTPLVSATPDLLQLTSEENPATRTVIATSETEQLELP
jgi:membrane protease YdiL (CAAX protease family)